MASPEPKERQEQRRELTRTIEANRKLERELRLEFERALEKLRRLAAA